MKLTESLAIVRSEIAEHRRRAALHRACYDKLNPSNASALRRSERADWRRETKLADALELLIAAAAKSTTR